MKDVKIQFLYEAQGRYYYRSLHNDTELIWSQDVDNPRELLISAESFAHLQGYGSTEEMLSDNNFLDLINQFMRETGSPFPFKDLP